MNALGLFSGIAGAAGEMLGTARETDKSNRRISAYSRLRHDNTADFKKDYYENALERMRQSAQLTRAMDAFRSINKSASRTAAVMNFTDAANDKQASAKALGDVFSDIAVAKEESDRELKKQYRDRDNELRGQIMEETLNRPTGTDMMRSMIGGFGKGMGKGSLG